MKISFLSRTSKETGTYYSQCISMTLREFEKIRDCFLCEEILKHNEDPYFLTYINSPIDREGNYRFINFTQKKYIENKFGKYLSRKLLDRNTYIRIINAK